MKSTTIVILLDYQGRFTSKWSAVPYKSGMNTSILQKEFDKVGFETILKLITEIDFKTEPIDNRVFLYPSSEDVSLHYKSFIEDIVYGLELKGATILPSYKLLRAHHNKVFMEILRDISSQTEIKTMSSQLFGTLEDFLNKKVNIEYPAVIKDAEGASSLGVQKANNEREAISIIKKMSRSKNLKFEMWDAGRKLKHKGYQTESKHRRKFIIQKMLPDLDKDWKVLIFGNKYFILERRAKKNDFRASGSGVIEYPSEIPEGMLDFAQSVFNYFDVPFFAMDIGISNGNFALIEFQGVYFGTHTIDTAPCHYERTDEKWIKVEGEYIVEEEMVNAVNDYIKNRNSSLLDEK